MILLWRKPELGPLIRASLERQPSYSWLCGGVGIWGVLARFGSLLPHSDSYRVRPIWLWSGGAGCWDCLLAAVGDPDWLTGAKSRHRKEFMLVTFPGGPKLVRHVT